ncbi:response regulator [Lachnospiraceae bacterium 47-T17]
MKTILVVDDDKLNLNSAMKILSPAYKVVPMTSGKTALSYLSKNIPDLILLDILMPEMDGFEVMKEIRANQAWADIPVIFLTGDVSPQTCAKGGALGVTGFMAKPLEAERMISGIEAVIGK